MKPKRYPYQGKKKGPIAVTIDPELKTRLLSDSSLVERLVIKNKNSEITFSGTKVEIKALDVSLDEFRKVSYDHETHCQLAKEKLPTQSTDSR